MREQGVCALYGNETELEESHIFPKFVITHTKNTGNGYIRRFAEPNRRMQDGIKFPLLSFKAEQDFALREKWFAENIFHPYLNGTQELAYDENLYYFAISFLWRTLQLQLKKGRKLKDDWFYQTILQAEEEWKLYLLKGVIPDNYKQICLFISDRNEFIVEDPTLESTDYFFTRVSDATIVSDTPYNTFIIIYGKFNRFTFWATLKEPKREDDLTDVIINPNGGKIAVPQKLNYFPITDFFRNRIRQIDNMQMPSENQQDKIQETISKDPDTFWKSDAGQSLLNDMNRRK